MNYFILFISGRMKEITTNLTVWFGFATKGDYTNNQHDLTVDRKTCPVKIRLVFDEACEYQNTFYAIIEG